MYLQRQLDLTKFELAYCICWNTCASHQRIYLRWNSYVTARLDGRHGNSSDFVFVIVVLPTLVTQAHYVSSDVPSMPASDDLLLHSRVTQCTYVIPTISAAIVYSVWWNYEYTQNMFVRRTGCKFAFTFSRPLSILRRLRTSPNGCLRSLFFLHQSMLLRTSLWMV